MKRTHKFLSLLSLSLVLSGCSFLKTLLCNGHIDADHDGKCDNCGKEVTVYHFDDDNDHKCDICGFVMEDEHQNEEHHEQEHQGEHHEEEHHEQEKEDPYKDMDFTIYGWDAKLAKLFYVKLGIIPPYVPSKGYKYEYGVDTHPG